MERKELEKLEQEAWNEYKEFSAEAEEYHQLFLTMIFSEPPKLEKIDNAFSKSIENDKKAIEKLNECLRINLDLLANPSSALLNTKFNDFR